MKIALLLAGCARRFGEQTRENHKALIQFDETCIIDIMFERVQDPRIDEVVIVTGHCHNKLENYISSRYSDRIKLTYVYNSLFDKANNMVSLHCLKDHLIDQNFLLINGDLVLNSRILDKCLNHKDQNYICVDDLRADQDIDSPAVEIIDGDIKELGRHLKPGHRHGYAIGMYGFNPQGSRAYFESIEKYMNEEKFNAGFHDPLNDIFSQISIKLLSVEQFAWTDLDAPEDIDYVREIYQLSLKQEKEL